MEDSWEQRAYGLKYQGTRAQKLLFIYVRDKAICHLCGRYVPLNEASRDHIIPKWVFKQYASGQKHLRRRSSSENIKLAHTVCNVERGTLDVREYKILKGYITFREQTND